MKAPSQPMRLLVAYGAIGGNTAHLAVLERENIFKKHGLDVSFIYMGGGIRGIQALVAGDISVCVIGGSTAITAILRGADIKILATTHYALDYWVFASSKIKTPNDLRGRKIGVSTFGSASDYGVRYTLNKWGLTPGKDVIVMQVGSQPERFAALESGSIDATVISPPFNLVLKQKGLG